MHTFKNYMDAELLFKVSNLVALIGWGFIILVPHYHLTKNLVQMGIIPVFLALIYLFVAVFNFGDAEGNFSSIDGLRSLFENDYALLAGWVHYLVFDQWVGLWETYNAQKTGIKHVYIIPCLILTLMLGPVGLLSYLLLRTVLLKQWQFQNFR